MVYDVFYAVAKHKGISLGDLATRLGVTRSAMNQWRKNGIPIKQCVVLEKMSDGTISRREMRKDDYAEIWPELA